MLRKRNSNFEFLKTRFKTEFKPDSIDKLIAANDSALIRKTGVFGLSKMNGRFRIKEASLLESFCVETGTRPGVACNRFQ